LNVINGKQFNRWAYIQSQMLAVGPIHKQCICNATNEANFAQLNRRAVNVYIYKLRAIDCTGRTLSATNFVFIALVKPPGKSVKYRPTHSLCSALCLLARRAPRRNSWVTSNVTFSVKEAPFEI
jgi:hypothetical protein